MNHLQQRKALFRESLQDTLRKLWKTEEDKRFLEDIATDIAKYAIKYIAAPTDNDREEAQFNLDMLQTNVASYLHQKGITAEKKAAEMAKQVIAFVIELVKKKGVVF